MGSGQTAMGAKKKKKSKEKQRSVQESGQDASTNALRDRERGKRGRFLSCSISLLYVMTLKNDDRYLDCWSPPAVSSLYRFSPQPSSTSQDACTPSHIHTRPRMAGPSLPIHTHTRTHTCTNVNSILSLMSSPDY